MQPYLPDLLDLRAFPPALRLENGTSKFDLSMMLMDRGESIAGVIEYNSDLFEHDTVARIAGNFQTLLRSFLEDPERRVSEFVLLTDAERVELLERLGSRATGNSVHAAPARISRTPGSPDSIGNRCRLRRTIHFVRGT